MALVLCPLLPKHFQRLRLDARHHQQAAPSDQPVPDPWVAVVHLDGSLYFYDPHRRVVTWTDPRDHDNAMTLENATQQFQEQLTPAYLPNDIIIVIGFTNEMRERNLVGYYLVNRGFKEISWIAYTPQTFGLPTGFDEDRFQSLLLSEYWSHIHLYPFGTAVDVGAEEDLVGRLIAGLLPANNGMTPFSPDQCRIYLLVIEQNRNTQPDDRRMTEIGRLLALIYAHLHLKRYGRELIHRRVGFPVDLVERRMDEQHELWQRWLELFAGTHSSISIACVYHILLAEANHHLCCTWASMQIVLSAGITATLLARTVSPRIYSYMESVAVGDRPNEPLKNLVLTCLFISNTLSYGILLNSTIHYLNSLEHASFIPRLILIILLLATPPVVYAPRMNNHLE